MAIQSPAIVLQVAIGLVLPVLASLVPFLAGLRVSASEAMSAYALGIRRIGAGWFGQVISGSNLWFLRGLPVRAALLSVRNMFRNPARLALTLITLTLASSTFISVFNMRFSLASTVDDMMNWFHCDVMLMLDRSYRAQKLVQEALRVPGIAQTDVWLHMPARRVRPDDTEGPMLYLFAPTVGVASLIRSPRMVDGRWLLPNDQNAIVIPSALLHDEPDLNVGGQLLLKVYGKERPFQIVGTYVGTSWAAMLFANYSYLARLTDRVGEADPLMVATETHDRAAVDTWSNVLEQHLDGLGVRVGALSTLLTEREEAQVTFDVIVALLLTMAVLLALVGGLGLMGTMSINVLERTRETGVLRAIGAPNRGVAQVFIREGIAIGFLSWLLGATFAIPMTRALNQAVGDAVLGTPLTYSYSLPGLWLWLLVVMSLSLLASFVPARSASRLTVREVLAYE
jgi:putative ABC transport system permease protein